MQVRPPLQVNPPGSTEGWWYNTIRFITIHVAKDIEYFGGSYVGPRYCSAQKILFVATYVIIVCTLGIERLVDVFRVKHNAGHVSVKYSGCSRSIPPYFAKIPLWEVSLE